VSCDGVDFSRRFQLSNARRAYVSKNVRTGFGCDANGVWLVSNVN
jgi:hypothetical protein